MAADPVAFAKAILDLMWEDGCNDLDNEQVQSLAEEHGLIFWRKPTPAELSDPTWWGREFAIGPDDEGVGDLSPSFLELVGDPLDLVSA